MMIQVCDLKNVVKELSLGIWARARARARTGTCTWCLLCSC